MFRLRLIITADVRCQPRRRTASAPIIPLPTPSQRHLFANQSHCRLQTRPIRHTIGSLRGRISVGLLVLRAWRSPQGTRLFSPVFGRSRRVFAVEFRCPRCRTTAVAGIGQRWVKTVTIRHATAWVGVVRRSATGRRGQQRHPKPRPQPLFPGHSYCSFLHSSGAEVTWVSRGTYRQAARPSARYGSAG